MAQDRHKRPRRTSKRTVLVNRKDSWSGITFAGERELVAAGAEGAVFDVTAEDEVGFAARLEFQNEIAARSGDFAQAGKLLESIRPVFSRSDAEQYQRHKLDEISALVNAHAQ